MMSNQYKNKLFSVLGDSISTLEGYSEPGDSVFYEGVKKLESDVLFAEDTWWGKVIQDVGGELLVNNSISGSMVCKHKDCLIPSYGCSDERTSALHMNDRTPDVIMLFLGINDWGFSMKTNPEQQSDENDLSVFSVAYQKMLEKLKINYPDAEIWCMTLPISTCSKIANFAFPYRYSGTHIEDYCEVIRNCAKTYDCRLIDLYLNDTPHDTIDGFHPNADGMNTLANAIIAKL